MTDLSIDFDEQIFLQQSYGGISRYFCELARSLVLTKHVYSTRIVAPVSVNSYLKSLSTPLRCTYINFPPFSQRPVLRLLKGPSKSLGALISRRKTPSILHETYYRLSSPRIPGAKRIITIHDMIHELKPNIFPNAFKTIAAKKASIHRADGIVCVSDNTRDDLLHLYDIDPARVVVIPHGVDHSYFSAPTTNKAKSAAPYVLFVGQRSGYKNFDLLLRAFHSSRLLTKHCRIVAYGGGKPTQQELTRLLELKLSEQVVFMPGSEDLLKSLYQQAECLIYPSSYEGFGMPILEAMACACPVIYSQSSALPQVAGDSGVGFQPGCVESLSSSIEALLGNSALSSFYRSRGLCHVKQFSWTKCADATAAFYSKIIQINS